jgi:hypothetical protein
VQVDDQKRPDDAVPEHVHKPAGLKDPNVPRKLRIETTKVGPHRARLTGTNLQSGDLHSRGLDLRRGRDHDAARRMMQHVIDRLPEDRPASVASGDPSNTGLLLPPHDCPLRIALERSE